MKPLQFLLLGSLFCHLPAYAQKDTMKLRLWREEVQAYLVKEGEMYEHLTNEGNMKGMAKWLRNNTHLDRKRLPHKIRLISVDKNGKGRVEQVTRNSEANEGVIWAHIVVNEEGKPIRIEFIKKSLPVFEEGLHNALLIMPFRRSAQPFRDYFLAVAFICEENYWRMEVL